ncbi:quinone oxidoreductase [Colletotrichum tofieldiae]|nr:quinone oxidoreductase [Colletotrichum tofieldiae]
MHAALVNSWAGVHRLVLSRAAGTHYTSTTLPHLPGADGVGEDPTTGQRYYFTALATGSFAEFVNIERSLVAPLPKTADSVAVAAYTNPVMSSWMAFAARTAAQKPGFSVAILGVTSASGRVAVDVARAKGAGRVVGIARNAAAMAEIALDERIVLAGGETDWSKLGEVDVVLDYVYGPRSLNYSRRCLNLREKCSLCMSAPCLVMEISVFLGPSCGVRELRSVALVQGAGR